MLALEHANTICDWQENLTEDEMPPQWMWPFDEELGHWFQEVEAKRKEKYGGGSEEASWTQNEYARDKR